MQRGSFIGRRRDGGQFALRPRDMELLCDLGRHAAEVQSKRALLAHICAGIVVADDSHASPPLRFRVMPG